MGLRALGRALLILAGGLRLAHADLPLHCLLQDIAGKWTFHVGPGAPIQGKLPACGHSIPNSVNAMLDINRTEVVPPGNATQLSITLTEDIAMEPARHLKAVDGAGQEGMWTMVFDTGFEIRIGDTSLAAHFYFDELPNTTIPPKQGDNWEKIGIYHGRQEHGVGLEPEGATYACHCDVTSTGWWHRPAANSNGSGELEGGCLWAVRSDLETSGQVSAIVRMRRTSPAAATAAAAGGHMARGPVPTEPMALHSVEEVGEEMDLRGGLVKEVYRPNRTKRTEGHSGWLGWLARRSNSLRGVTIRRNETSVNPHNQTPAVVSRNETSSAKNITVRRHRQSEQLPQSFDWREELAGMVPPGEDPLGQQVDQGPCGSCYAFAGIMVLQMRFRVQLFKQHGLLYPLELSYKSPTRCSPYTEGCDGGFSYFVDRLAYEIGVPLASCDKEVPAGSLYQTCDWSCYRNNSMLFYAQDYWHVGGFSHGSDEESIMREIYLNGPVELGFSTPAVPEFVRLHGDSASEETDVMTIIFNGKASREQYSTNPDIHRWWFATHAILGVGWGNHTLGWGMVKYWWVRNSWGRGWGEGGYAKMRRGNNDGGIETDASMVVPDMGRLPAGFLESARKYHEEQAANREKWRQQAKEAAAPSKAAIPDYCEQRPNSPDCQ